MAKAVPSRFAVLKIEDDDDEDVSKDQGNNGNWKKVPITKKSQKQKKQELGQNSMKQQQPSGNKKNKNKKKKDVQNNGIGNVGSTFDESQWKKQDDERYVDELQKVLLLSKQEFEKDKNSASIHHDSGLASDVQSAFVQSPDQKKKGKHDAASPSDVSSKLRLETGGKQLKDSPGKQENIFRKIDTDVQKIIEKERRQQDLKENFQLEAALRKRFENEIKIRDEELTKLREDIAKMQTDFAAVKKRNKQLCFILAQGEMKEKAELITQLEQLTQVKDEMTEEISSLTAQLQKERSEVHRQKEELRRLQPHH